MQRFNPELKHPLGREPLHHFSTVVLAGCLDMESNQRGDNSSLTAFDRLRMPSAVRCCYLKLIECNVRETGQRDDKRAALCDCLQPIGRRLAPLFNRPLHQNTRITVCGERAAWLSG